MANELGNGTPFCDESFKNYGVTDIDAGLAVLADASNPPSGDSPPGIVLPTASGGVAGSLGVTLEKIRAGKTGRVRLLGVVAMTSNGSITYGGPVQISDTALKLGWAKACGAATQQIGKALGTGVDGQPVRVVLTHANNA